MLELIIYGVSFWWWLRFRKVPYFLDRAANGVISDLWFAGNGSLYKDIGITYMPPAIYGFYGLVRKYVGKNPEALNTISAIFFSLAPVLAYRLAMALGGFGWLAAAVTLLLMSSLRLNGTTTNYENFTNVVLLLFWYAMVTGSGKGAVYDLWCGLLFGFILLIKQIHVLLLPVVLVWLGVQGTFFAPFFFIVGCLMPSLVVWLLFRCKGADRMYLYWNWMAPFRVINFFRRNDDRNLKIIFSSTRTQPFLEKLPRIKRVLVTVAPFLLPSLIWSVTACGRWNSAAGLIAMSGMITLIMVPLGGAFRPQYWLNIIPWVGVACPLFWYEVAHMLQTAPDGNFIYPLLGLAGTCQLWLLFQMVMADAKCYRTACSPYHYLDQGYPNNRFREYRRTATDLEKVRKGTSTLLVVGHIPEIFLFSKYLPFTQRLLFATAEDYIVFFKDNRTEFPQPPKHLFWHSTQALHLVRELTKVWDCEFYPEKILSTGSLWRSRTVGTGVGTVSVNQQPSCLENPTAKKAILYIGRPMGGVMTFQILSFLGKWVAKNSGWELRIRPHPEEDRGAYEFFIDEQKGVCIDSSKDLLHALKNSVQLCISPYSQSALYAYCMGLPLWMIPTGQGDFEIGPEMKESIKIVALESIEENLAAIDSVRPRVTDNHQCEQWADR